MAHTIANNQIIRVLLIFIGILLLINTMSCRSTKISSIDNVSDTIVTNSSGKGWPLKIEFARGASHNHPLMAIWITDTNFNYIETLYIAKSIAKGVFEHGDESSGKWMPGPIRRPAALPVWAHNRNIQENDGLYIPTQETAMPDAITGATPPGNFILFTSTSSKDLKVFDVYLEINQSWDWNEYWTNNKYPEDEDYKTSCQPSLIYKTTIDVRNHRGGALNLKLVGHGHFSGENGAIHTNLNTITTAKNIVQSAKVQSIK
jgi:hypothetical protein